MHDLPTIVSVSNYDLLQSQLTSELILVGLTYSVAPYSVGGYNNARWRCGNFLWFQSGLTHSLPIKVQHAIHYSCSYPRLIHAQDLASKSSIKQAFFPIRGIIFADEGHISL